MKEFAFENVPRSRTRLFGSLTAFLVRQRVEEWMSWKPVQRIDTDVVVVMKESIADSANAHLLRPPLEKDLK